MKAGKELSPGETDQTATSRVVRVSPWLGVNLELRRTLGIVEALETRPPAEADRIDTIVGRLSAEITTKALSRGVSLPHDGVIRALLLAAIGLTGGRNE